MIETDRLILRPWRVTDRPGFAAMNADPEVMAHFPKALGRSESDATLSRLQDQWHEAGIAFGAVERKSDGALLGMTGLARATFDAPVCPCVEVGWRFARVHWGRGYATEAARGWIAHGFDALDLHEIVAFVVPANLRSQAVMARLGMQRDPDRDFAHPALPETHPLRHHWLYFVRRLDKGLERSGPTIVSHDAGSGQKPARAPATAGLISPGSKASR